MLHAKLHVDLPSALPPPSGVVARLVDKVAGRADPDERLQRLMLDNLTVFHGFLEAFGEAGFDDVVSVVVDGKPTYVDTTEKIGDLENALARTVESGALDDGFSILRATLCRLDDGLRLLGELRARARVPEGEDEVVIRISAREDELDLRDDEGPKAYAARVREYIRNPDRVLAHRDTVEAIVAKLAKAIPTRIPGAHVGKGPVIIRIVALGPRQVGRMRHLRFHTAQRRSVRSALSGYERIGAYDDPLAHHYYAPIQDLFDWIALGEVLAGHWASADVHVVHPTGRVLFCGDEGSSYDASALEVARDAIRVDTEGRLVVDASIPHVDVQASVDPGSPHGPGWGGEQWAEDG